MEWREKKKEAPTEKRSDEEGRERPQYTRSGTASVVLGMVFEDLVQIAMLVIFNDVMGVLNPDSSLPQVTKVIVVVSFCVSFVSLVFAIKNGPPCENSLGYGPDHGLKIPPKIPSLPA